MNQGQPIFGQNGPSAGQSFYSQPMTQQTGQQQRQPFPPQAPFSTGQMNAGIPWQRVAPGYGQPSPGMQSTTGQLFGSQDAPYAGQVNYGFGGGNSTAQQSAPWMPQASFPFQPQMGMGAPASSRNEPFGAQGATAGLGPSYGYPNNGGQFQPQQGQTAWPVSPGGSAQPQQPYFGVNDVRRQQAPYGMTGNGPAQPGMPAQPVQQPQSYTAQPVWNPAGSRQWPPKTGYVSPDAMNQMQGGYRMPGQNPNQITYSQNSGNEGQVQGSRTSPIPKISAKQGVPFTFDTSKLIILCTALAAMFIAAMLLKIPGLCFAFAGIALASVVLFWLKPLIQDNTRLCYTVVFAALAIIALVTGLTGGGKQTRDPVTSTQKQTAVRTASNTGASSTWPDDLYDPADETRNDYLMAPVQAETPEPEKENELESEAVKRLESFFYYWTGNRHDEMLNLCAPSWQSAQEIPKNQLFSILANRKPLDYEIEKVSGTENDLSRTVTLVANIDRNNGKEPTKYRLQVIMMNENGAWYVDPNSLKSYDAMEETPTPAVSGTPEPSATPAISGSTILFYNTDGGTKYHLDQNCKSTHSKYLPFKGQFRYDELNDDKYKKLSPCNVCGAPLRP